MSLKIILSTLVLCAYFHVIVSQSGVDYVTISIPYVEDVKCDMTPAAGSIDVKVGILNRNHSYNNIYIKNEWWEYYHIDPTCPGRIGDHYFYEWCPYVRPLQRWKTH